MKISSVNSFRRAILPASILAAMAFSGSANAFKIDSDNSDIDIRWDNTFRYNAGWRMSDQKWDLKAAPGTQNSDSRFKNGGMVTNRLDVLSEFDFIYKKDSGFRVSAAGWYDARYNNHDFNNGAFVNNKVPDEINRYYNGPSGEFLDAFVFTKLELGDVPVNVKLGQHTIYWGETLFSLADGVSAGQSYADLRKALATPGAEAKEIFKPLNQFSFSAQLSPELTVMGQYFFDYKPDLFPLGGTYFSPAEFLTYAGETNAISSIGVNWDGVHYNGLKKRGDWGLAAKWRPEWLDGTAGFYYREYTAKNGGALAINVFGLGGCTLSSNFANPAPCQAGLWIDPNAPKIKLYGLSLAKQVLGISWGMDLTYRKDATLQFNSFGFINGDPLLVAGGAGQGTGAGLTNWAPVGDIYTAVFNMIAYDGKRGIGDFNLYDSAVLTAEFNYDALDKITRNAQNANSRANCQSGTSFLNTNANNTGYQGCFTGQSYGISFLFEPKWFQVFPGTDISMPIFYTVGLKGNSTVPAVGSNEGMGAFSYGLTADVDAQYNFALKYNGNIYKRKVRDGSGGLLAGLPKTNAALGDFSDRGWISFTAKATW